MVEQPGVLQVSKAEASDLFMEALELARGDHALPAEWIERTAKISGARNRTYTPVLGTVLLAKATNKNVSALALKIGGIHRGYSPRSLAKDVFVPRCVENRIDIRTKGAEPFNNQPFFAKDRIHKDLVPPSSVDRSDLEYLVSCLEKADYLEGRSAILALAAFLRVRIQLGDHGTALDLDVGVLDPPELGRAVTAMINKDREGGRRGQAFVAACLELVYAGRTLGGAINDPSNRLPGDIAVMDRPIEFADATSSVSIKGRTVGEVILAAEVKQKPVVTAEVLQFAERLAVAGIGKALYAALHPAQADLTINDLQATVASRHNIHLSIFVDPVDLLYAAIQWSPYTLQLCLAEFPNLLARQLDAFNCDSESQHQWLDLLLEAGPPSEAAPSRKPEQIRLFDENSLF